jgi:hypothetical protein
MVQIVKLLETRQKDNTKIKKMLSKKSGDVKLERLCSKFALPV